MPEKEVERVTAMPEKEGVKRQKDPKKVAAGRAGAAAKKANQEKLQAELREAKAYIQKAEQQPVVDHPPAPIPMVYPKESVSAGLWIIGGLGLAGAIVVYTTIYKNSNTSARRTLPTPLASQNTSAEPILKTQRDPFHME